MSQGGLINATAGTPAIPTSFVTNSGIAIPAANILNVLGGSGATTSGAGNTVTIAVTAAAFTWNVITSATNPNVLVKENAYITKGAGAVVMRLPATAAIGDAFLIVGYGNLWQLTQNAGQSIFIGNLTTTVGVGGSITATAVKDLVQVVCVTANTEFQIVFEAGNITVV